jgi:copper homeostasis protein
MCAKLEICCYNLIDGHTAQIAGADQIELCSSPFEGGITPSYGLIKMARYSIAIPISVIIRPRGGNFIYSDLEWLSMKADIMKCQEIGIDGISIGLLTMHNSLDLKKLEELQQIAGGMKLTFHRAFDLLENKSLSLENLIELGFDSIMTSGSGLDAFSGVYEINQMVQQAANRIKIIAAGGIRPQNLEYICINADPHIIHSSLISTNQVSIFGQNRYISMENVKAMCEILYEGSTNLNV